ncbi:MAG: FkbM family methyltransferase [Acidobacteriota bacterium]|nr:FkbM family methyltransferase [Acidobacteriota bacterium]
MRKSIVRSIFKRHSPSAQAPSSPRWVEISAGPLAGRELFIADDTPSWRALASGDYEPFIFDSLGEDGYEGKTVWDIGAFVGYHALAFAALVGSAGRVVTFEPNPYNVERVKMNLEKNPDLASRIVIVTKALANEDGQTTFLLSPSIETGQSSGSHMTSAMAPEAPSVYESFEHITVDTVRADTLVSTEQLPAPALIKMDVEGAELMVLQGSVQMLADMRPTLLIEIHHIVTMFETHKLLGSLEYELRIVNVDVGSTSRCHLLAKPQRG